MRLRWTCQGFFRKAWWVNKLTVLTVLSTILLSSDLFLYQVFYFLYLFIIYFLFHMHSLIFRFSFRSLLYLIGVLILLILSLSLSRGLRDRSVTAPTVWEQWTVCAPPSPFTQSVSSTLAPFIIDHGRATARPRGQRHTLPSGISETAGSFREKFLKRRTSCGARLWALGGSWCSCEKWTSWWQYVTVRARG